MKVIRVFLEIFKNGHKLIYGRQINRHIVTDVMLE